MFSPLWFDKFPYWWTRPCHRMSDLWWLKWHWDRGFSGYFGVVLSVGITVPILHTHITFVYHRSYIILVIDRVVKWHIFLAVSLNVHDESEMLVYQYFLKGDPLIPKPSRDSVVSFMLGYRMGIQPLVVWLRAEARASRMDLGPIQPLFNGYRWANSSSVGHLGVKLTANFHRMLGYKNE
jgi:hypothetical protein